MLGQIFYVPWTSLSNFIKKTSLKWDFRVRVFVPRQLKTSLNWSFLRRWKLLKAMEVELTSNVTQKKITDFFKVIFICIFYVLLVIAHYFVANIVSFLAHPFSFSLHTLREEILADLADSLKIRQINFPPKLTFFAIRQIKFPPKLSFFAIRQIKFPPKLLFFDIRQKMFWFSSIIFFHISYSRLPLFRTSRYFEQKSQKHEKTKNER